MPIQGLVVTADQAGFQALGNDHTLAEGIVAQLQNAGMTAVICHGGVPDGVPKNVIFVPEDKAALEMVQGWPNPVLSWHL